MISLNKRYSFLSLLVIACPLLCMAQDTPTLKEAVAGRFEIGVGISDTVAEQPETWDLLTRHFTIITPENCMKPASVQPSSDVQNFQRPDQFVEFAVSKNLKICGHCLVWAKDDRTPEWFFKEGDGKASRDVLLNRMRNFIKLEVGRYKGKIAMWDVVNEVLDDGNEFLRPSGWTAACGEDFIAEAFRCAHEADPDALLIYNDYNNELPGKREKQLKLIDKLLEQKVPIHAVGLQGHYEIDKIPLDDIEKMIVEVNKRGLKVVVSELDIDVIPRSRWWADGGKYRDEMSKIDPYKDGCPPEILQRQAEQYAALFKLFNKHASAIMRVSFWNLHDGQSWLNYFPWNRVNHPLLFDRQMHAKPGYKAVIEALAETPK
jgi:endo-1,4-beta-xylanase